LSSNKSWTPRTGDPTGGDDATERLRPVRTKAPATRPRDGSGLEGKLFSHYQLGDRIGGGGMGVIYRGTDTRLEREVAVKFLAQRFTGDEQAKLRFLQEARAASAIDHPNICTIFEINETDDGELYLVMAYYEGQTLAARIRDQGPLPVAEALDVTRQTLAGLGRAHESGIVHRDIKPGNLMLTPYGEVKILDFGLAKLAHGAMQLTQTGFVHGTAAYMSPEQARGEKTDHRGDIWATGVVLYQMLAGHYPFRGEHPAAILYAVVHDEAPSLAAARDDLSFELEEVLSTALQKDPDFRYQTARDMADALDGPPASFSSPPTLTFAQPGVVTPQRSILVLPFSDVSHNKEMEFFSDGLTDEVITDLSVIDSLRVISRTSAMQLKNTDKDIRTIGRELGVRYIVEGAVRIRGDSLRLTAKLVDAGRDVNLWAQKFSGQIDDILEIQEQLSRQIVDALKVRLTPQQDEKLAERPIADARAYECYLRAKQQILSHTEEGLNRAFALLDEAERIVGENLLLLSARAYALWHYVNAGLSSDPATNLEEVRKIAKRVLEIDPDSSHGHRLIGMLETASGHPQEGVRHLKRALAKDPNDVDTLSWMIALYALVGLPATGLPMAERLLRIDPLTPFHHALAGFLWVVGGDPERGLAPLEKSVEMEPENQMNQLLYAQNLATLGRSEDALKQLDHVVEISDASIFGQIASCLAAALRGDAEGAACALTPEAESVIRADPEYPWMVAQCHALLGDGDEAVSWLRSAVEHGFINYPLLAEHDPHLEPIRDHEGFQELLSEVEERWRTFEA